MKRKFFNFLRWLFGMGYVIEVSILYAEDGLRSAPMVLQNSPLLVHLLQDEQYTYLAMVDGNELIFALGYSEEEVQKEICNKLDKYGVDWSKVRYRFFSM